MTFYTHGLIGLSEQHHKMYFSILYKRKQRYEGFKVPPGERISGSAETSRKSSACPVTPHCLYLPTKSTQSVIFPAQQHLILQYSSLNIRAAF